MRAVDRVHRGTHEASGLILHQETIGRAAAQQRVLAHWRAGASLFLLPDANWLFLFSSPVLLSAVGAGAQLVVKQAGGFSAAPFMEIGSNEVVWWSGGSKLTAALGVLAPIDPSEWVDLQIGVHTLSPIEPPRQPVAVEPDPPAREPDLRQAARVGKPSPEAIRFAKDAAAKQRVSRTRVSNAGRSTGTGTRSPSRGSAALARLVLRSPLRHEVSRRHAKYLERLNRQFTSGDLGEALRNALPLGGGGDDRLTLGLPARRDNLRLTAGGSQGGAIPFGPEVQSYLRNMYQEAARDLEAAGQIDEAAFVLAELLHDVLECIALLERHKRFETAAAFAENRAIQPALTIRLWWLAGDRLRAMRLARKSNEYALVLERLVESDPENAHQFRLGWVDELERSGNVHAAVAVGWPDERIRPLLMNMIERGIEAGDDWSLGMQAYRVALRPNETNRSSFKAALAESAGETARLRYMATSLDVAKSPDPVADREICTSATRELVGLTVPKPDKAMAATLRRIRNRSDPVLAADLPFGPGSPRNRCQVEIPPQAPGAVAALDVVPITFDRALLALGESGIRLVTFGGQTIANWSTPCHHLVPVDQGHSVIVLTERGTVIEASILDLATRKTRRYGPIRTNLWAKTFDGMSWAARDEHGIAFYDMLATEPQIAWRELEPGWTCHQLERSPTSLAALVTIPGGNVMPAARSELWRWELPQMRLDKKERIEPAEYATHVHLLSDATSIWQRESVAPLPPAVITPSGPANSDHIQAGIDFKTSAELLGTRNADGLISVATGHNGEQIARWPCDANSWGMREHGGRLSLWNSAGSIAHVDTEQRELLGLTSLT